MKRAVSISIGSSKRDKAVEVTLLGEKVSIERLGTDGDMEKAALKYKEMDGKVDAFGVGGADLGLMGDNKWYPLYSVRPMIRFVKVTPIVDGVGLKNTLENKSAPFLAGKIGDYIDRLGKKEVLMRVRERDSLVWRTCLRNGRSGHWRREIPPAGRESPSAAYRR